MRITYCVGCASLTWLDRLDNRMLCPACVLSRGTPHQQAEARRNREARRAAYRKIIDLAFAARAAAKRG